MTLVAGDLTGKRVLVVEDEPLIALDIVAMLDELGCTVAGVAGDVCTATRLARDLPVDVALLDLILRDASSYDVAQVLLSRSIPVILATGLDRSGLPEQYRRLPMLGKPFGQDELAAQLQGAARAHDAIELTAYFLWEQDGRPDGKADQYWAQAQAAYDRQLQADALLQLRPG